MIVSELLTLRRQISLKYSSIIKYTFPRSNKNFSIIILNLSEVNIRNSEFLSYFMKSPKYSMKISFHCYQKTAALKFVL